MRVKMTGTTRSQGYGEMAGGSVVEVDEETAQHLISQGIAEKSSGDPTTSSPERDEARRSWAQQELETAARHGDVDAALRLDRIKRGEEELPVPPVNEPVTPAMAQVPARPGRGGSMTATEPTPEPTPEPEPTPTPEETTGSSARRTLAR